MHIYSNIRRNTMSFVYKGLEASFERHIVTEHEVEHQLEHILAENPKTKNVTDRPAKLGDEVILDYAGFCEGEQFAGGTAEKQSLTLGSGMFIPGFEEQLVGKKIGEETSVMVTFPEQYHAENLAGKPAEFKCKIHEIHEHSKYELNDDFAKKFGNCETMEEFREKLAVSMQDYADENSEIELQDKLFAKAAESLEYTPSDEEIERELDEHIARLSEDMAQHGLNLEMYCQFSGTTEEQIREEIREKAVETLRGQAVIDKIAELENLSVDEQDLEKAFSMLAAQNGMPVEFLKEHCDEEIKKEISRSVLIGKVMRLIRENAVVTEGCGHDHCHCHCH
ncbi:MAG: trigger factor [Ruminococcaceae bacterium]|nr:trigger factor [Oscillospiraceae bacterium]